MGIRRRQRSLAAAGCQPDRAEHVFWIIAQRYRSSATRRTQLCWCSLFLPPTLGECRHCDLACHSAAVSRCAIFVVAEGERSHPRRSYWCRCCLHDEPLI